MINDKKIKNLIFKWSLAWNSMRRIIGSSPPNWKPNRFIWVATGPLHIFGLTKAQLVFQCLGHASFERIANRLAECSSSISIICRCTTSSRSLQIIKWVVCLSFTPYLDSYPETVFSAVRPVSSGRERDKLRPETYFLTNTRVNKLVFWAEFVAFARVRDHWKPACLHLVTEESTIIQFFFF